MMLTHNPIFKSLSIAIASIVITACDTDFSNPVGNTANLSSGSADFTTYVSIGDSLTAGYADGALYLSGQENSYPSVLAQQFSTVGGGTFNQPLVSDNLGGLLFSGVANPTFGNRLILDAATSSPEAITGAPTTEVIGTGLNGTMFSNTGVPGAKSYHLVTPNYGDAAGLAGFTANPYYVRFASSATSTVIADAAAQTPSFFTLWIGNNDVLSYATTGGIGVDQTGLGNPFSDYGSNDITDPTAFAGVYNSLVADMTTVNSAVKGVLVSIPDVSTIPFFTTVPFNPVPLDQATADLLNAGYVAYNGALAIAQTNGLITVAEQTQRTINFSQGQNAVVILDEDLTDLTVPLAAPTAVKMRHATADDLIVLLAGSKIGTDQVANDPTTTWGVTNPLLDSDVLIPSEILAINTARLAYNATIAAIAGADANLAFYDAAADLLELSTNGIDYGTGFINSTYATGGGFSLDGVHPTARGYAFIANRIIETINTSFGATVPSVDPGARTTIFFK